MPSCVVCETETDERPHPLSLDETAAAVVDDDEEDLEGYPSLFIGPQLRAMRQRARLRQSDIARLLGIDSSIPSRWEGFDGQTTRYKPVPGKYFMPLASLLGCKLLELAPELGRTNNGWSNGTVVPLEASCPHGAPTTSNGVIHTSIGTISSYTLGGGTQMHPTPQPGIPPEALRERGEWRRYCPNCHKAFVENALERAPLICDACAAPVRAQTSLTLGLSLTC